MNDVTKIDDAIRYLDFEPKKKFGGAWWLAALLAAPCVVALLALLIGTMFQVKW